MFSSVLKRQLLELTFFMYQMQTFWLMAIQRFIEEIDLN